MIRNIGIINRNNKQIINLTTSDASVSGVVNLKLRDMEKAIINGLTQEDIVLLYKYVDAYEKKIRNLKNNEKIREQEEQLKEITKSIIYKYCHQDELEGNDTTKMNDEIYFAKGKTKTLSFLYHLRNSIAHSLIKKVGTQYKLTDKNRKKKQSMVGSINSDTLEKIIKIFI